MSDFDHVYDYVRAIPRGRVTSYGDVGAATNAGAREVGWAMGVVPDGVPWQRVVGADGTLRIAKRDPHLRQLQQALLEDEGVTFDSRGRVERRFFLGAEPEVLAEEPVQGDLFGD